ncbi:MAG: hypothetical protein GQ570_11155 [Helicobacteraceae bacterium]|nr:hypothetical protein [Helicobacteraceae bacterium]
MLGALLVWANAMAFFLDDFSVYSYKSQIFSIILWLLTYIAFKHENFNWKAMDTFLAKISKMLIITYAITLFIVYAYFLRQGGFYLGFSSSPLLIPFVYFLIKKKWSLVILTVVLIAISGKRGVFIVLPVLCLSYLFLLLSLKEFLKTILLLFVFGIVFFVLINYFDVLFYFESSVNKFKLISKVLFSNEYDLHELAVMSSGRSIEIIEGVNELNSQDAWLRGLGYGFQIEVPSVDGSYSLINHYVHFTPFNFILQYGLILGSLFLFIFVFKIINALVKSKKKSDLEQFFLLLSVGYLLGSLTNYSMSFNPIIWMTFIIALYGFRKKELYMWGFRA